MTTQLFTSDELKKFEKIYKNLENDDEFEIMFGGYNRNNYLNLQQFNNLLSFLKKFSVDEKLELEYKNTLDIAYNYDKNNFHSYRISIKDLKNINDNLSLINERNNNIIYSMLISKIIKGNKDMTIINKIKNFDKTYNIDNYDIRVRLSKEKKVEKKELEKLLEIKEINKLNINYRFKNRLSVIAIKNSEVELRIDLTNVKSNNNINRLQKSKNNYELEIDFNKKKKITAAKEKKYLNEIMKLIIILKKVIEQNNFIISKTDKQKIIGKYNKLVYGSEDSSVNGSYTNNSQSLEIIHIVDYLPNKYSVTDKADGDRYLGFITDGKLYFITTNLNVKYSGITIKNKKYNDSIIDGEYIYIAKYNKYVFATFDILFSCGKDIRKEDKLKERMVKLDKLLKECFNYDIYSEIDYKNIEQINSFNIDNMKKYVNDLNNQLASKKDHHIIVRKYFMFANGLNNSEIFEYAHLMWNLYTNNSEVKLPYFLDGLVFTPLNQIYTKNAKEIKFKIYKWKPANQNSIDFFIRKEVSKETSQVLNVYDDTLDNEMKGKSYQIINLYVGKNVNNTEIPILFQKHNNLHKAYIFTDNGVIRDIEGHIIQDNTVVEFYYDMNSTLPQSFRWIPLRTRYDKTESINRFNRKYGNYTNIANMVWNSIQQHITMNDFKMLVEDYDNYNESLKKRINASYISSEKQQDVYYQKVTNLAKPMRDFNNYIKSNLIFSYCSKKVVNKKLKKMNVLDVGCGRGGDIQKFYHSRVGLHVGFDPDPNGIYGSATDGAVSRYNNLSKKFPDYPKMNFLVMNAKSKFNLKDQLSVIGKTRKTNEELISKFFGKSSNNLSKYKFDVFNCQLMIHFLFDNDESINNFCDNINNYLDEDGTILMTTLDGDMIHEKFNNNNGIINSYYFNENGDKVKFFEFIRTYDKDIKNIKQTGLSYKAYISLFKEEGQFDVEYLVSKEFLIEKFKKIGLELVETDMFINCYYQQKYFFENIASLEENKRLRSYFMKIKEYYNLEDEVNKASLEFTKYHRYYIFKKINSKKVGGRRKKKNTFEI